jgi:Kelch motif/Galactose oxidase, central domain/Fibronectin type III domain
MAGRRARRLLGVLLLTMLALAATAGAVTRDAWTPTGSLMAARGYHGTALLDSGKVFVAGGAQGSSGGLNSTEIYDPATGTWAAGPNLSSARVAPVVVKLANGMVLIAGGGTSANSNTAQQTADIYDPTAGTLTPTAGPPTAARAAASGTLLPNGKVLIVGGGDSTGSLKSAELYDPSTGHFTAVAPMATARDFASIALLPSGKVLVAGGGEASTNVPNSSGEIYEPGTGAWTTAGNAMSTPREGAGSATLPGGKVLIAGGLAGPTGPSVASTDVYDPATNAFSAGPSMAAPRAEFAITALRDGRVLVAGGVQESSGGLTITGQSEILDSATNAWGEVGTLSPAVFANTATLLPDGRVLDAGGFSNSNSPAVVADAALLTPSTTPGPPVAVSAGPGNGSAVVTFAPPADDGGLTISHYTVTASSGQTVSTPDGRTYATVSGLANGKPVTFTVTATNARGTGPASAASNAVTPSAPPVTTPPDLAPGITVSGLAKRLTLKRFLKGLTFSVKPSKAASFQIELVGTVNRATISRRRNLILVTRGLRMSASKRRVKLVPNRKLVGRPKRATVLLIIVATDQAGSRRTVSRTITVHR